MTFLDLRGRIKVNIFTFLDVLKFFPEESTHNIKIQLSRFSQKGLIHNFKREWYCFDQKLVDSLEVGSMLYKPSYISIETALNYFGIIPDIPQAVTLVTTTTTKKFKNVFGNFYYTKIKPSLFFGFTKVKSSVSEGYFNLAGKEKAILDFFYLRKITSISDLRLNLEEVDQKLYRKYAESFPSWIPKI